PPGITARFNPPGDGSLPAPFEVPFPSDLYRDSDGTLVDTLDRFAAIHLARNGSLIAQNLRDLDGFGLSTGAMFLIDGTPAVHVGDPLLGVDPASLPANGPASVAAGSSAFIVDLDPALTLAQARVPSAAGWHATFRTITVQPDRATLAPGHRYAVVLTNAVHSAPVDYALRPSAPFAAVRDGSPGARTSPLERLYGDAADRVVTLMGTGFDRATIAALAVFTTQTTPLQLRAARDALVAGRFGAVTPLHTDAATVAPFSAVRFGSVSHAGWTATLDAWLGTPLRHAGQDVTGVPASTEPGVGIAHDALGAVFTATFGAPDFRATTNGHFIVGNDGVPVVATPDRRIPITIALPRGPVPAGGFPVVFYAHGLGGQRGDMLGIMNEMARAGFATVSIDWSTFGQRAAPMPADVASSAPGAYHGPDGFADTTNGNPLDFVGGFQDMGIFRDNLRQSALEIVQLRRVLADPALDLSVVAAEYGGTAPRLDGQHVAYVGGSLGGIIGTLIASVEPQVNPFVLNVAGAAFATQIVTTAPNQAGLVQALLGTVLGAPSNEVLDRFHPVANLLQMALDGGDPVAYAHDVTRPLSGRGHDVWLIEALWDETVGNASTDLLASLLGLPQLTPAALRVDALPALAAPATANLPGGLTGGFYQLAPSAHYGNLVSRESNSRRFAPPFPREGSPRFPTIAQPYTVRELVVPLQRDVASFITSTFAGASRIDVTGLEPLIDLDDDGWTDAEETAASTDPFNPTSHPAGAAPHTRDLGY
ncbi:MAG: hypothetical protein WCJ30_08500, partial [Deltaproteobacteria bacterium]